MTKSPLAPSDVWRTFAPEKRHIIDGFLMAIFIVRIALPGLPATLPLGDIAALVLIILALLRSKTDAPPVPSWFVYFFVVLMLYLVLTSTANDVDWMRRGIKILILALLAGAIASGRVDLFSGLIGLGVGLLVNVPVFWLGLTPDTYDGALTGLLGDKNIAGLYYAVVPFVLVAITKSPWKRWLIGSLALGALSLTGSRSSIAAALFAFLWLILSNRLKTFGKVVLGAVLFAAYQFVNDVFSQFGDFSDRAGTDALRARIDDAAIAKVDIAPWYGLGLGESHVPVQGQEWFFHNSYLALMVEGGLILAVAIVGLHAIVGLRLFQPAIPGFPARAIEAATVALLLCSLRLGEVFFTIPGFLVVGMGLLLMAQRRSRVESANEELAVSPWGTK